MAARKKSKKTAKRAARAREPKRRARPAKKVAKRTARAREPKRGAKKAQKRPAKKAAKRTAKKVARRTREPKRGAKKAAKRQAKRPAKKSAKRPARPTKKVARPTKKTAKRPARSTKKTAKRPARPTKKVARPTKKTAKRPARPTKKVARPTPAAPASERARFPESQRDRSRYTRIDMLGRARESLEAAEARRTKEYGPVVAKAARKIEEMLEFVASMVRLKGYITKVHVHANADSTVDGDLSIAIQPEQANERAFGSGESGFKTGLLSVLYHAFADHGVNKVAGMWFSVGFYLPSESQVFQASDRRPYKRYEGALRFGYAFQRITGKEDIFYKALESARITINGVLKKHDHKMTGMYVRVSWSEDGSLRRRR